MSPKQQKSSELPTHVRALGVPFRVEVVDGIDDEGSVGETSGELRLIRIHRDQDSRRRWTTLLHEYMHATLDTIGIANTLDEALEEVIVQSLEHAIEQFMLAHGQQFLVALSSQKEE